MHTSLPSEKLLRHGPSGTHVGTALLTPQQTICITLFFSLLLFIILMSRGENSKTPSLSARSGHARTQQRCAAKRALKTSTAQKIPMNRLQDSSVRPHHTELQHRQCLMTSSSYVYPSTVSLQPAPTRRRAGRYSPRLAVPPADQQIAMPCEPATRSNAQRSEPERRAVDVARCRRCCCCRCK